MRLVDLVVLDLAGTTVRDGGQVPDAFAAALATCGVHVTRDDITRVRGASKRQAIRDLLAARGAQAVADDVYQAFREDLERRYAVSARAIDGAEQTMTWLRRQAIKVALNTGFDRPTTTALLGALGWAGGFADAVACGDDVAEGRPDPALIRRCMELTGVADPGRVANVGDTVLDLRAAARAGVRFNVGVLSGAHGRAALQAEPHTHLLPSVADLPTIL